MSLLIIYLFIFNLLPKGIGGKFLSIGYTYTYTCRDTYVIIPISLDNEWVESNTMRTETLIEGGHRQQVVVNETHLLTVDLIFLSTHNTVK